MTKPKQSGKRSPKRNGSEPARLQSVSKAPKTATKKGEHLTKSQAPRPYTTSPAAVRQRQLAAVKSGLYVKAPNGMQLRHRRVRRLVSKAQAVLPWLRPADLPTLRGWAARPFAKEDPRPRLGGDQAEGGDMTVTDARNSYLQRA